MKNDIFMTLTDVEGVSLRAVAGAGDQIEMIVRMRHGELTMRLIGWKESKSIRVVNLRKRDKNQTPKLSVPFLKGEE